MCDLHESLQRLSVISGLHFWRKGGEVNDTIKSKHDRTINDSHSKNPTLAHSATTDLRTFQIFEDPCVFTEGEMVSDMG